MNTDWIDNWVGMRRTVETPHGVFQVVVPASKRDIELFYTDKRAYYESIYKKADFMTRNGLWRPIDARV